jgi:dihydropteroate synthase
VSVRRPPTRIGSRTFAWGERTFVMGIVNVTPDSFSGDGILGGPDEVTGRAVEQARRMVEEGADLLDVGGESTRPGHAAVSEAEEQARVVPVIQAIRGALPEVPISIDTTKPAVAEAALDAGADLVNDVWGVTGTLDALAATREVPIVLMHNRREPRYADAATEVVSDLAAAAQRVTRAGIDPSRVILDPGIGFGKTADHNLAVLGALDRIVALGYPVLLGTSRKSTIGRILDLPADQRLEGTLATTVMGIAARVDIVRVHDVAANVRAVRVADAIVRGWRPAHWDAS